MRPSPIRQFSIAVVASILIMSGASIASAADETPSFSVTASPSGAYAIADEGSWVLQMSVTQDSEAADLSDVADLTVTSVSSSVTVSSIAHPELGLYVAHVYASEPGTYPLSVQYNGQQIGSYIVQFFSSGPDPSHSTLFAIPEQILATCGATAVTDPVIATATVRDDQGSGIPGLEVIFDYGTDTPEIRTTDNDGVASAELFFDVPEVPTTKTVNATVSTNGESVDLPSAFVEIEPTEGCSGEALVLNWRLESTSQVVGLSLRVLITALDVNGQITTMDPTKLTVEPSSDAIAVGSPVRRFDGSYSVSLNTATPGDYAVSVIYDGRTYGLSMPFSFRSPTPLPEVLPDLDQSYIYVSKWLAEPGDQVVVTAVMRDSEGQGVENAQVFFSMTGSDVSQTTCVTLADGRCSITVSAPIPATFDILARFNGQLFGAGQTAIFLPEQQRDYLITMEVAAVSGGPMRADGYDPWEAWITILNADGTPVTDALSVGIGLTVVDTSNDAMVMSLNTSAFEVLPGGVYHAYLTSLVPGSFLVYAYHGWTWADPVTVSFSPVPANEPGARLILAPLPDKFLANAVQVNENDREVQAEATVHDEQGLPISSVKVDFVLGSDADVLSARQCYTDAVGQCSVRVWPNGLGEHSVYASIAGEPLIGSPATVRLVSPGYPGEFQLVMLDGFTVSPATGESVPADGVSSWVGTVALASSLPGYPLTGLAETVEAMLTPSNPVVSIGDVIDNDDNTYTVSFTSGQAGEFDVTAYFQGVAIERDITFGEAPPVPDPEQSSLAAASALSSVGAPIVLTVMVKDSAGVAMEDVEVSFTAEAPGVLSQPTCTTDSDGRCTVSVSSGEAASIHVSASVDGQEISGSSLLIRFQSSSPSASTTSASPSASTTSPSPSASTTSGPPSPSSSSTSPSASPTSAGPTQSSSSASPTQSSTSASASPTQGPTSSSSQSPTQGPTGPTQLPTSASPSASPTSAGPTQSSSSASPAQSSTSASQSPTQGPTSSSSQSPTQGPTGPTQLPTSASPTQSPTSAGPTQSQSPTDNPTSAGPTQGPGESPTSSVQIPRVDLNTASLAPGQTLRIGGENWFPGEIVRVTMYSTERVLGTETVNPDGTLPLMEIVIPADLEAGQHTIRVEGSVSGVSEASFTVLAPVPATAAPAISTGGTTLQSPVRWVVFGFLSIGMGLFLNRIRRQHLSQLR